MTDVEQIVKEYAQASRKLRASFKKDPKNARKFLTQIGVLTPKRKRLTKRSGSK